MCRNLLPLFLLMGVALLGLLSMAQAQQSFFEPVSAAQGRLAATARAIPNAKLYTLNEAGLRNALANTAKQYERGTAATIALPLPDGTTELFAVRETQVLSPALAAENPTIKTYEGEGTVHKGYIIRMSLSSLGFEALIWGVGKDAVYFARLLTESGSSLYQSYYARDARKAGMVNSPIGDHHCGVIEATDKPELPGLKKDGKGLRVAAGINQINNGTNVRQLKIAVATTGEWSRNAAKYDGTQTPLQIRQRAFAVVVTSVNRINGIYERELACRFQITNPNLSNNQTNIIFDDPITDPYSNTSTSAELASNQSTLDNRVGTQNYDVGHLFGTRGGGVAASPSLCATGSKAKGYSARGTDTGDPFVVDYFAHELGHQFDMDHTYNVADDGGTCTTRAPEEAYEVASGSTIMSYVGICSEGRNLQEYNDFALPSFHISSITKATAYLTSAATAGCGTTAGTNAIPTVSAGSAYTIPRLTPFTLTATGADADAGDAANLSYSWEEFDLAPTNGATGDGGTPKGVYDIDDDGVPRPILRAYSPVKNPQRTFPSTAFILNPQNNATPGENQPGLFYTDTHPTGFPGATCPTGQTCIIGERLPTIARTMNFRVSVRDLRGGVADAGTVVTVVNTPGAFRLTSFDNASTVAGNSQQTVTWNVVNTNQAPVNCANVAIKLSTDGGLTFPTTLLASTPNDGSELVMMPNVASSTARLRVEAVGNIFFDISNTNFTITPVTATAPVAATNADQTATVQTAFSYTVNAFTGTAPITYSAAGLPNGLAFNADTRVIAGTPTTSGTSAVTITGINSAGQDKTVFAITVNPTPDPEPTAPFAITSVTTLSCEKVTPTERRLTFNPQYTGLTGQPIKFVVVNEIEPTMNPGPYAIRIYTDNPTIRLKATQTGTANDAQFTYNWLAQCDVTTPPPSDVFAITAVTTVSCATVTATERRLTFNPEYSGLTGQPIKFVVVNEIEPTMNPGPYAIRIYTDNPTIRLKATQTGTQGDANFTYNWLAVCNGTTTTPDPEPTAPFAITSVTTLSCEKVTPTERRLTFNPQYTGLTGQPIKFVVVNEIEPTMNPGPYAIRIYTDNPTIRLKATQTGTANDAQFTYNWLAQCDVTTPPPSDVFAITAVTTVSCATVTATERRLTFNPEYSGLTGQPIKFVVVNEIEPTMAPGPYAIRVYTDNPTIRLKATQTGTANDAQFTYNWLAQCDVTTPPPSDVFAITAVTTVSCATVTATERRLTFNPEYSGLTGQPIKFVVVNEIEPTMAPGPYAIRVYTDNPVIRLRATQTGTQGDATFTYDWLANCRTGNNMLSRGASVRGDELSLSVRVLGNPISNGRAQIEVTGAYGQPLQIMLTDMRGTVINAHRVEQPALLETHTIDVGRQPVGTMLLQVSTDTQSKTVKLLKTE